MTTTPDTVECQICGEEFDPTSSAGWCTNPECGEWQWTPDEDEETGPADEETGPADENEVECPSCGSTVPDKEYCLECGDPLDATDSDEEQSEPESAPSCPNCGEDVESDWAACPHCGTSLESTEEDEAEEPESGTDTTSPGQDQQADASDSSRDAPQEVVVEVGDVDITAADGDTVGRKVRSAYVRTGAAEEEAQYIHREHVLFEREDGDFYVVNKGRNGTKLNGEELDMEERRKVEEGDTIEFSNRASGDIRLR